MKQDTKQYISQAKAVPSELSHSTDYTPRIFDPAFRENNFDSIVGIKQLNLHKLELSHALSNKFQLSLADYKKLIEKYINLKRMYFQ